MSTTCSWRTAARRAGFAQESLAGRRSRGQLGGHDLDGHDPMQLLIEGPEHDAHAAAADQLKNFVVAQAA
jgi:hypothetical protein